jgi:hypothetical protein
MKYQIYVSCSGIITLDVTAEQARSLDAGEIDDLADIVSDWDDVLNQLEFDVDDALKIEEEKDPS